jgi:hypothetical protein
MKGCPRITGCETSSWLKKFWSISTSPIFMVISGQVAKRSSVALVAARSSRFLSATSPSGKIPWTSS